MASFYEHDYEAFGEQVLRAPFMLSAMRSRATSVMAMAQSIAPVDDGDYLASFEMSDGLTTDGTGTRVYARVANTAGHAAAVEYGFRRVPRYRVLGKSMHAAGGDVKGSM